MKYLKFTCPICNQEFQKKPKDYNHRNANTINYVPVCSSKCLARQRLEAGSMVVICLNCNKNFYKTKGQLIKSPNSFCSKSCAATYNNKHKSYGTRRSKLEVYLEKQIRLKFPNLILECNSKSAINSELDFYFPQLRFAIELNGIVHYEPIYGTDKFEKIQDNDKQKLIQCYLKGIELAIVDSSTCKYLNQSAKDKYLSIVLNLIETNLYRLKTDSAGFEPA